MTNDGKINNVVVNAWKIQLYSFVPSNYLVNDTLRLVIEKWV